MKRRNSTTLKAILLKEDPTSVLPEEIVEQIFLLLPVEDILSCCLVSSSWRNVANSNIIWKHFCGINLKNAKSVVKPKFKAPAFKRLTPTCGNRINYMKEMHVRNNLRRNNSVDYRVEYDFILDKLVFLNNYRYILLNTNVCRQSFEVWDIKKKPVHVQTVPHLLKLSTYEFTSFGDCLLVLQGHLLQIYSIVNRKISLKMCKIFDMEEAVSQAIPASDCIATWYSANFDLSYNLGTQGQVLGKYFCGVVRRSNDGLLNQPKMHIWDLDSGKKLNEEKIPVESNTIQNIELKSISEHLYIAINLRRCSIFDTRCKIISYDLNKLQYMKFYFQSNFEVEFFACKEMVVALPNYPVNRSYILLDSVTGDTIQQKHFAKPIFGGGVDVYNNIMAYSSRDTVTVMDIRTQQEVAVLHVANKVFGVHLLDVNTVLVGGGYFLRYFEVWDIRKKCKLYRLDDKIFVAGGNSRTLPKLFFSSMNTIHIHHYW